MTTELTVWEKPDKLDEIKKRFCEGMPQADVELFVKMGIALNLNPYMREIWAIPYNTKMGKVYQIFVGRDGYRKNAQKHPLYSSHYARPLFTNDKFQFTEGKVMHEINMKDRGQLYGAYALVYRHGATEPVYVEVLISEYSKAKEGGYGSWDKLPAPMISKVAEAQALRMAFQEMFAGTYDESEQWKGQESADDPKKPKSLREKLGLVPKDSSQNLTIDISPEVSECESIKLLIEKASVVDELKKIGKMGKNLPEEERHQLRELYTVKLASLEERKLA